MGEDGEKEEEKSVAEEFHEGSNELEKFTMAVRKKWKILKAKAPGQPKQQELTTEEKKLQMLADIIKTYRHVDMDAAEGEEVEEHWVDRPWFDIVMVSIVLVNIIMIGIELDDQHGKDSRHWGWILCEVVFMIIFVMEVYLKIKYHTWIWILMDTWNMFTFLVASMYVIDCIILQAAGLQGKLKMFSLLRVLSLLRMLRLVKNYKSLKELRLVMQGLLGSLGMLSWTVLLLIVFLYVSAVFTTSTIGRSDAFPNIMKLTNGWDADELFGSVGKSMFTLMQCMTRDGWSSLVARYVMITEWYMAFFFMSFMMISTYGLLNLVISVIVEQTLTAARANEGRVRAKEEQRKKAELEGLKEIFKAIDKDGSGELDVSEFLRALEDEEILWKMRSLDLPIDDAARLFTVIDGEGNRPLTMEEFIDGCTKLKGPAASKDLLAITAQADTLSKKMDSMAEELQDCEKMLHLLDDISIRITNRFAPAIKSSRKKIAKSVGGSAPVVPMHPEKLGSAIGVDLAHGNRPLLPAFPQLLG